MAEQLPTPWQQVYERLVVVSSPLARRYTDIAPALHEHLSAAEVSVWAHYCEQLAQSGWRTWESAEAFCRLSPFLLRRFEVTVLWQWVEEGRRLARLSADVATAFFRAARPLLQHCAPEVLPTWAAGGHWYLQHHANTPSLAVEYFQLSPQLYARYPRAVCGLWRELGQDFARAGRHHGRAFFEVSRTLLEHPDETDQATPWELAQRLVSLSPDIALQALERYPDLLHWLGAEHVGPVCDIVVALLTSKVAHASAFLRLLGGTLGLLPATERRRVLDWCQHIAAVSPAGVLDFLPQLPELTRRLPGGRLQAWITTGIEVAKRQALAGQAYFALESATAHDRLRALQSQVTFADDQRVLQLYTEGLAGRQVELRSTADLPAGLHLGGPDLPTSDGTTIFVPAQVDEFSEARENFFVYKAAILHQLGFSECGTFTFSMQEWMRRTPQAQQPTRALEAADGRPPPAALTQFFATFPQPALARQLFAMLEDARIDAYLLRQYKGIRRDLVWLMQHSLRQRPALGELPLRPALLEGLLQFTLGASLAPTLPFALPVLLPPLLQRARPVLEAGASVYTAVAAVLDCYLLITQIPAQALAAFAPDAAAQLAACAAELPEDADTIALADLFRQAGEGADSMPTLPDSSEPAMGGEPVPYRGEAKPELVQKKMRLQELAEELQNLQEELSPIPPELLKEILEKGDIEIKSLQDGDLSATSGLFLTDLEGREGMLSDAVARHDALQRQIAGLDTELQEEFGELKAQDRAFLYDEWDYQIHDYRRRWCRLTETVLPADDTTCVEETRQKYAELLTLVRRQFQLLKPEMFKKIKRLIDGEEIDLDAAIEAWVDRRAGNAPSEKIYMRRNKRDRDVAAVFLLDMSASTDDDVPETRNPASLLQEPPAPAPRQFDFSGFIQEDDYMKPLPKQRQEPSRRRVIDVEKEALILMAEALEALGDAYAIYGFSGYGRDQVDFFVAKEFAEGYDERTQGRIGAIKPHRSTRMGPAIRHAIHKLERQDARIKTLLMLSDGYPQDYDYGKDRTSKEYGIQDTMMALREAQLQGIQTFCITVDPAGHDYLRQMCPDQQYLVIDDIAALPDELPKVYRGLTT